MKKINAFFLLFVVVLFIACNDKKNNELVSPEAGVFSNSVYAVIDFTDVLNSVENASLDNEISCSNSMANYTFINNGQDLLQVGPADMHNGNSMGRMGPAWVDKFDFNKHLGRILRQLDLTDQQKADIKDLLKTFHNDMKPLVKDFTDAIKEILKDANLKRKDIIKDLRAGTITRNEALTLIETLNLETRDEIKNNTQVKGIKDKMCALRAQLLGGIETILTDSQKTRWNDWISKISNPC